MKFYTHLEKYVSKVSTNFELNRTCESTADLKIRTEWGFVGVFSKRTQRELNSDHDQELHREGVCSDPKSLSLHKSIPNNTISKELEGSPQNHK